MLLYKEKDAERLNSLFEPLRKIYAGAEIKTKQYVHKETPIFKFEYPDGSKDLELIDSHQVLRMRAPNMSEFDANVADIPKEMKLEDIGPKFYLPKLKEVGTNFDVISNESITLKDGTKAYKTKIKWLYKKGQIWITTLLV